MPRGVPRTHTHIHHISVHTKIWLDRVHRLIHCTARTTDTDITAGQRASGAKSGMERNDVTVKQVKPQAVVANAIEAPVSAV